MRRRRISFTSNISENPSSENHSLFFHVLIIDTLFINIKLGENIIFQKLNRKILNDAVPKKILSNIDWLYRFQSNGYGPKVF